MTRVELGLCPRGGSGTPRQDPFPRVDGLVHDIAIDSDAAKQTITFYELPISSLMMVPGVGVEPTRPKGSRDFKSLASTVSATPAGADSTPFTASNLPRRTRSDAQ